MRLKLSPAAQMDVIHIYRQSRKQFGERQADRYYDGLVATLEGLKQFPEAAPVREKLKGTARVLHYGSHHIVYRVDVEEVVVLRILHGRMDVTRHLK